jgi:hypothetical protein
LEELEDRLAPAVMLTYGGPATALGLTELTAGATPTVNVSEATPGTLKIDLGTGQAFAPSSTKTATGLVYQNAGSPSTSQYATVDISTAKDVSAFKASLVGGTLNLGPIEDTLGGLGSVTASAAVINVNGLSTAASGGNVNLAASGALTVASNAFLYTGHGTISLAADVNANGTGDSDTTDALAIQSGAVVTSSNPGSTAITLRGAAINIDTSSDPAQVGGAADVITATLTGPNEPFPLAFDSSGNLFVGYQGGTTVSEYAPNSTTPTATLTGLKNGAGAMAFDSSGNLFVANLGDNYAGTTVSEFAPDSITPKATLTGLNAPTALAFDHNGNLFVANYFGNSVSEFAPGSTTPKATLTGLNTPRALAFDASGNLFVANRAGNTVSEFAPGSSTPTATLTGLNSPIALAFGSSGNLFATNVGGTTVSEFAPGSTSPTNTLTGLNAPDSLAFDGSGNLFVANRGNLDATTVSEFAPGHTTPTATLLGLNDPEALAFDPGGNLFVANFGGGSGNTVSEFANTLSPPAGRVVIRTAQPSQTMSIGGSASGANINLTSAELAQIFITATGTITFGDTSQTGTITFQDATPATTSGASLVVQQAATGAGQIVLDASSGIALSAGRDNVTLNAGKNGITAKAANSTAEIASTGKVTLNSTGPIGSASNPIQFDGTDTPASVVVGPSLKPSSIYLAGLANLTLGNITVGANATIDVTAAQALTLAAKAVLSTGTGNVSLSAGSDFNNAGTLIVNGATVTISGTMTQLSGTTLTGGAWIVNANSNLNFPAGSNITALGGANVTLNGTNSNFVALANLATIKSNSTFTLSSGRTFTTAGNWSNAGTLTLAGGTLNITGSVAQLSGTTLTAGTWVVNTNSNLKFAAGSNITALVGAKVTLNGANSTFAALANLATIASNGSFSLLGGQSFTAAGSFTNNGKLTVGPGSTLTANGSFTQASTATLTIQLGGTSSSPTYGQVVSSSGTVTLAGTLQVTSTVVPAVGSPFEILANEGGSPISGTFKELAEGATFTVKTGSTTMTFKISYVGDGGNNVVITRIA